MWITVFIFCAVVLLGELVRWERKYETREARLEVSDRRYARRHRY